MTFNTMNPGQARVIDPILSTHAVGYTNGEMIAEELFPTATINARGAKVIKFGKDGFRAIQTQRSPGGNTRRVSYGYASDPIALFNESLEGQVSFEDMDDANVVPGIDLGRGAVDLVLDVFAINRELAAAALATNPANFSASNKTTLTGTDKWSDDDSDPIQDILDAREVVRGRIGRYPNKLTLGAKVFARLKNHPKVVERIKYTSAKSVTADILANLCEVKKIVVGSAVYLPETAAETDLALDIWPNSAVLAYVPEGNNYKVPSFGYTYSLKGHPFVESPYMDRNAKSWLYPVTAERRPYLTGIDAGFLFDQAI